MNIFGKKKIKIDKFLVSTAANKHFHYTFMLRWVCICRISVYFYISKNHLSKTIIIINCAFIIPQKLLIIFQSTIIIFQKYNNNTNNNSNNKIFLVFGKNKIVFKFIYNSIGTFCLLLCKNTQRHAYEHKQTKSFYDFIYTDLT